MIEPESHWNGQRVFIDFSIEGTPIGRVTIELAHKKCPQTSENFRQLCCGEFRPKGFPVGYLNTKIHRIIPGFMIQGGDCDKGNGEGCLSIYGYTFEDEESAFQFDEAGIVAMANSGPDTNGCQFFITLDKTLSLEGQYVSFGKVIDGMLTIRKIEAIPLLPNSETPSLNVTVSQCGEL